MREDTKQSGMRYKWDRVLFNTHLKTAQAFFLSVCFYADLLPVAYQQFLPPVVDQYSYKNIY